MKLFPLIIEQYVFIKKTGDWPVFLYNTKGFTESQPSEFLLPVHY